jgi:hypothetical protein
MGMPTKRFASDLNLAYLRAYRATETWLTLCRPLSRSHLLFILAHLQLQCAR